MRANHWINAIGIGLILVLGLNGSADAGPAVTETGTDQPIVFIFPPGVAAFSVMFRSDIGSGLFGEDETTDEVADLLTVTFPGAAKPVSTAGESGTLFQTGFVTGKKIDQVTVNDPGLFGGISDFVALFFDATHGTFAVGFTSDTAPEPATAWLMTTGLIALAGYRRLRK